jgi:hypothetical protein
VGGPIALGILCSVVLFYGNGCFYGHDIYGSHTCTIVLNPGQEVCVLGLGYIGYSVVLFGFKMEPSCRELNISCIFIRKYLNQIILPFTVYR